MAQSGHSWRHARCLLLIQSGLLWCCGKGRVRVRFHRRQSMPRPPAPARAGLFSERANHVVAGNGFQCQAGIKLIVPPQLGIDEWVQWVMNAFSSPAPPVLSALRCFAQLWQPAMALMRSPDPKDRRRRFARKASMPLSAISGTPPGLGALPLVVPTPLSISRNRRHLTAASPLHGRSFTGTTVSPWTERCLRQWDHLRRRNELLRRMRTHPMR